MKNIVSVLFVLFAQIVFAQSQDPVLMTVGDTKVTASEFTSVYHKNNTREENSKEALDKYLDLFTNFKLKVSEALELKMDTVSSFISELGTYRKQLAQPYLTDKDVNEKLLMEAYERLKNDIRASHILVKVDENALPKDTMLAYAKIMKIRARILKGEDFAKVARENSDDPSVKDNGGDLGYFTAMQMVYPFESAAYNTKVGEISMPVRTRFGYHIIKSIDKRKAQGEILVAHIMVKTGEKITPEDAEKAKIKINELYDKVKAGEDFAQLAKSYSDDKNSGAKGGELPWFGTSRMPIEFEKASFALQNNGDVSAPFATQYGWHIVKRINKKEVASYEEMKGELKGKVSKDSRSQVGRSSLIAKIKKEYNFKEDLKARNEFYKALDTSFFEGAWSKDKAPKANKVMFNLLDQKYTQADFASYINSHQSKHPKANINITVDALYNAFVDEVCVAFEEARLESKYPEFKALMQEYKEGILLFELTDKKVWSKAVKDTVGLKEFYEKNKTNYMWDERADATIYTCKDAAVAVALRKMLKKNKSEKEIMDVLNKTSQLNVQSESKYFNKNENKMVEANWTPAISPDIKTEDGKIAIVVVHKLVAPTPKAFNEAKGLITSDYQTYLEKEWINSLKAKYKVTINKDVLSTIK